MGTVSNNTGIGGLKNTFTLTESLARQPSAVVISTKNSVDTVGVAIGLAISGLSRKLVGVQLYETPPPAESGTLSPIQTEVSFEIYVLI
jgi:hypothetical protein